MTVRSLFRALTRLAMIVGSLFQALTRLWSDRDSDRQQARLELELLEGRLCPAPLLASISDPSQLPLQLPSTFRRGEHVHFMVSADTIYSSGDPQFLTLTSSTGDLNVSIPVGPTVEFDYVPIQKDETFSVDSSDGHEFGTIIAYEVNASRPAYSVSSAFWNWQKLLMVDNLQNHLKDPDQLAPTIDLYSFDWPTAPVIYAGAVNYGVPPDYLSVALQFDDRYFHDQHNQDRFTFQDGSFAGSTLLGHEVNYYFQGMLAAAYGVSWGQCVDVVSLYYKVHHGAKPNANVWLATSQGYQNYQADYQYWEATTLGGLLTVPQQPPAPLLIP